VRDEVASSVGENASTKTSPKVKVKRARPRDDAGSIGEGARANDEGESESARSNDGERETGDSSESTRSFENTIRYISRRTFRVFNTSYLNHVKVLQESNQ
jgi:hypothetical protein